MNEELNLAQEVEKHLSLRHAYEQLQASPAWATLSAQLEKQITVRTNQVMLTPLAGADAAFEQEYTKGEIAGMRLVLQLPKQTLDDISDEIARLQELQQQQGDE